MNSLFAALQCSRRSVTATLAPPHMHFTQKFPPTKATHGAAFRRLVRSITPVRPGALDVFQQRDFLFINGKEKKRKVKSHRNELRFLSVGLAEALRDPSSVQQP